MNILSVIKNVTPTIASAIAAVDIVADLIRDEDPAEVQQLIDYDPELTNYTARMVEELAELNARLNTLADFLDDDRFEELTHEAQHRVIDQRNYMTRYAKVLRVRIERD